MPPRVHSGPRDKQSQLAPPSAPDSSEHPPRYLNILILTDNVVSEANGAEGDEGKVETLSKAPAFHMAEQHGWEDENDQTPQGQEQSQAQDLQELEREGLPLKPLGRLQEYLGCVLRAMTENLWVRLCP